MRRVDRIGLAAVALAGCAPDSDRAPVDNEVADTGSQATDTAIGETAAPPRTDCVRARTDYFQGPRYARYATDYQLYDPTEPAGFGVDGWFEAPLPMAPDWSDLPPGRLLKWSWEGGTFSDGSSATYVYDDEGRLARQDFPDGWKEWTFDEEDRPALFQSRTFEGDDIMVMEYTYNALGRLTLLQTFHDYSVLTVEDTFTYDASGNMVGSETDGGQSSGPDGTVDRYAFFTYDDAGRVLTVEQHGITSETADWRYSYDDRGRLVSELYWSVPYWRCTQWSWDEADRVVSKVNGCRGEVANEETYTYDDRGNLLQISVYNTYQDSTETTTWTYDDQDRRTNSLRVQSDDGQARVLASEEWAYTEGVSCALDNEWTGGR